MSKTSTPKFYLLNLNLNSPNRKGKDVLSDFFLRSKKERKKIPVRGSDTFYIRLAFESLIENEPVVYGRFSKFIDIDGKSSKDIETAEDLNIVIPPNAAFDLKETNFIFYPKKHRLAVEKSPSISINYIVKYIESVFRSYLMDDEYLTVTLKQDEDSFDRIYEADLIKSLVIKVSYTNDDINKDVANWFDDQLKDGAIREMLIKAVPDKSGNINPEVDIIKGAMELSKENGYTIAKIKNKGKRPVTINTNRHPEENLVTIREYGKDPIKFATTVLDFLKTRYFNKSSE
jgi:hypothetical protein